MSAATMSDGTPVTAEHDARMLEGLREWRRRYPAATMHGVTGDELDMLFRRVDELTAIERLMCAAGVGSNADLPDLRRADPPVTLDLVGTR